MVVAICFILSFNGHAQSLNGFDLKGSLIPKSQILRGGPPRDGIPSIDSPAFVSSEKSDFSDEAQVLGVHFNGIAKAYPIGILNWHEIVNDKFEEELVSVTYCPLCGSGMAYSGEIDGKRTTFGVSGLLFNSDVLLYDRRTNSLWSQILNKAVTGEMKGTTLTRINTQRTSLGAWKKLHPQTQVLSANTGFQRDYQRTPYAGYDQSNSLYFPVANKNDVLHAKEWVLGVEVDGKFKAYPIKELVGLRERRLEDTIGNQKIILTWDQTVENVEIRDASGNELISIQLFWFAWYAFHPDSEVWSLY